MASVIWSLLRYWGFGDWLLRPGVMSIGLGYRGNVGGTPRTTHYMQIVCGS